MQLAVALVNLVIGLVYTSYGIITVRELAKGWRTVGPSHFGLAWTAMAFTCGPHHLAHAVHVGLSQSPCGLELATVIVGVPAGVTWFLLRVEAIRGGPGDRPIAGDPLWVRALPIISVAYIVAFVAAAVAELVPSASFSPRLMPNIVLSVLYLLIGYFLLRTQLSTRAEKGGWSLSGIALTIVFPTCALMHLAFLVDVVHGRYTADVYSLVIDWLAVPAAAYFLWVVRRLYLGTLPDWNLTLRPLAEPVGTS
jgi:hypothetical protein